MFDFRSKEKIIKDAEYCEFNNDSKLVVITVTSKNKKLGELKGVIDGENALLGDIDIPEEYVNYGIGSKLLERFEVICIDRGANVVTGNLSDVDLDHKERLIHFYEKHHYMVTYEDKGNYWGRITKKL